MASRKYPKLRSSLAAFLLAANSQAASLYINGVQCQKDATVTAKSDSYGNTRVTINCPALFNTNEDPDPEPIIVEPDPPEEVVTGGELLRQGIRSISVLANKDVVYQVQLPYRFSRAGLKFYGMGVGEQLRVRVIGTPITAIVDHTDEIDFSNLNPGENYTIRMSNIGPSPVYAMIRWYSF